MKIKKIIIIIITILLLLLALVVGYEIAIRIDNNLDRSNEMSREEVINLVEKDYNNYVLTTKNLSIFTEQTGNVFVKDNVIKKVAKDKCHEYINYNTDERIDIFSYPLVYISSAKDFGQDRYLKMSQKHGISYYNITDENKYAFEYLGEKDINGRKTIVIKLTETYNTKNYDKYYIDKETGIIVGQELFYYGFAGLLVKIPNVIEVEFDCVTDEDVKRPNTVGSVVIDYREMVEE